MPASNRMNTIYLVSGQTKTLRMRVKTKEGKVASIADAKFYLTIRKVAGSPQLVQKTSEDGIVIYDLAKGEVVITLTSVDTEALSTGTYRYDIWAVWDATVPPVRQPIVDYAEVVVGDTVTEFS